MPPKIRKEKSKSRPKRLTKIQKAAEAKQAAEEAARAEAARLEALRLEEEARLEKIREMERELATPEGMVKDFKKWFYTIPLSQPDIVKIERDFSDGALVAEIIAHYKPDVCDPKSYFRCLSYANKWSNWSALNRKVLPLININLSEATICNLIQPWSCSKWDPKCPKEPAIFKLLRSIRDIVSKDDPNFYDFRMNPPEGPDRSKEKPKITSSKRNPLYPPMSIIELWLENGHLDEIGKENEQEPCSYTASDNDWVRVYLPGGEILLDDQPQLSCE